MSRILPCLALCLSLVAGESNDWLTLPGPGQYDANLSAAAKDPSNGLATVALGMWAEGASAVAPQDLARIGAYCQRGQPYASRAAIALACSPQRSTLVASLAAQREGRRLAAMTLAAWAIMQYVDDAHLTEMRAKSGIARTRSPGASAKALWGCGGLSRNAGGGGAGKTKGSVAPGDLADHAKVLADLIASPDAMTRISAGMAAAYGGIADPAVAAALGKAAERNGTMAAILALHQARTQAGEDPVLLATASAERREQPPVVEADDPSLSLDPLSTPAMAMVCESLLIRRDARQLPLLHQTVLNAKDLRVRYDALRALRAIAAPESVPTLIAVLAKLDRRQWPLLVQTCAALADIPDGRAVGPLIAALERHEQPDDRFRQDIMYALRSITAPQNDVLASSRSGEWKGWWEAKQAGFVPDAAASREFRANHRVQDMQVRSLGDFYDLPLYSDRFAMVLDYSNSMGGGRIDELRQRATTLVDSLPNHALFNIVAFNAKLTWLNDYDLFNDRRKANDFIANTPLKLHTRSYDATESAFSVNGSDTLYLLTDGQPTTGSVVEWSAIMPLSNLLLRYRPIAIFTIDLKGTVQGVNGKVRGSNALEVYAHEHAGLYAAVNR